MNRLLGLLILFTVAGPASAHFIWFVPMKGSTVQIVFSDSLEPDANVAIGKIAQTQLFARSGAAAIEGKKSEAKDHFLFTSDAKLPLEVGGVCQYGVLAKKGDPYLLMYYAKASLGTADSKGWSKLPLEIVPAGSAPGQYQVLWQGKPEKDVEVIVLVPGDEEGRKPTLDKDGRFNLGAAPPTGKNRIGIRARFIEKKAGELEGKKYAEVRHYTTWVFDLPEGKKVGK